MIFKYAFNFTHGLRGFLEEWQKRNVRKLRCARSCPLSLHYSVLLSSPHAIQSIAFVIALFICLILIILQNQKQFNLNQRTKLRT